MGTRSAIGIIGNESVRGIYCHWDGYIEHNGQILNRFYPTANLVNALIEQGDLSSLGSEIGTKHQFGVKPEYIETDLTTSVAKECKTRRVFALTTMSAWLIKSMAKIGEICN